MRIISADLKGQSVITLELIQDSQDFNMNLPANSTFLPVLDDLLSPDFRPLNYPAQTPQTPTDVVSFGGGKIITNAYGNITGYNSSAVGRASTVTDSRNFMASSLREETGSFDNDNGDDDGQTSDVEAAASKIQNWWKSRRSVSIDLGAERAKHSIRHNRTEDHIRHLESEVNRLKAALSSERKIRSLQLEAIRSLWSQLQRISNADSSNAALMTRSVPNGLPPDTETGNNESGVMSMSLSTALEVLPMASSAAPASQTLCQQNHSHRCSCSNEVQQLREVFTQEIGQLRGMIDQLSSSSRSSLSNLNNTSGNSVSTSQKEEGGVESEKCPDPPGSNGSKQQKRPGSLNLPRASNPPEQELLSRNSPDKNSLQEEKIVDYASQMASKLVDDAVEDKENTE